MSNYLYNGVELPPLPKTHLNNTDGHALEYAVIYNTIINGKCELVFVTKPFYKRLYAGKDAIFLTEVPAYSYTYELINGEWTDKGAYANPDYVNNSAPWFTSIGTIYEIVWSNHDIIDSETGAVYLAASEPVPVGGEPVPVSPYLPINGAWVKHDIYKQVGNTWVKQPQGAVEVEDGAWQGLS